MCRIKTWYTSVRRNPRAFMCVPVNSRCLRLMTGTYTQISGCLHVPFMQVPFMHVPPFSLLAIF